MFSGYIFASRAWHRQLPAPTCGANYEYAALIAIFYPISLTASRICGYRFCSLTRRAVALIAYAGESWHSFSTYADHG